MSFSCYFKNMKHSPDDDDDDDGSGEEEEGDGGSCRYLLQTWTGISFYGSSTKENLNT